MMTVLPSWSSSAHCTLEVASRLAASRGLRFTAPEHFLLALCRGARYDPLTRSYLAELERRGPAAVPALRGDLECLKLAFREGGGSLPKLEEVLERALASTRGPEHESTVHRSPEARMLCRAAMRHCLDRDYPYLRAVHLLGALAEVLPEAIGDYLAEAGMAPGRLAAAAWKLGELGRDIPRPPLPLPATPVLNSLLRRDLRCRRIQEGLSPFLGRELEINALADRLCFGGGACVLLYGEPGSGRTALVEALSARIFWEGATYGVPAPRLVELCPEALAALPAEASGALAAELSDRNLILLLDPVAPFLAPEQLLRPGPATLSAALHARTVRCIGVTTPQAAPRLLTPEARPHWHGLGLGRMPLDDLPDFLYLWRDALERRHNTVLDPARFAHLVELSRREHLLPGESLALLRRELEPHVTPRVD